MILVTAQCKDCGRWSEDQEHRDMLVQVTVSAASPTPMMFARCINRQLCDERRKERDNG